MSARIDIDLGRQELCLDGVGAQRRYAISSAANGPGEQMHSQCTPRGRHRIRARIGAGLPLGSVLVGRRPTGEIYSPALGQAFPGRDWILTRILWLAGLEPGRNRYGAVDTQRRFIYIHGTPDAAGLGRPGSHGCIRMANEAVAELFEQVRAGCPVELHE